MSGYDYEHINISLDKRSRLGCAICHTIVDNPYDVINCRHTFCKSCIDPWYMTNYTCPICRTICTQIRQSSRILFDELNSLDVKCLKCDWTGTREEYSNHTHDNTQVESELINNPIITNNLFQQRFNRSQPRTFRSQPRTVRLHVGCTDQGLGVMIDNQSVPFFEHTEAKSCLCCNSFPTVGNLWHGHIININGLSHIVVQAIVDNPSVESPLVSYKVIRCSRMIGRIYTGNSGIYSAEWVRRFALSTEET